MGRLATSLTSSFSARCLGLLMAVLLALTPLGQACAMSMPAPDQAGPACHHPKSEGVHQGECPHHPGSPCHCAAAGVALPATPMTAPPVVADDEPVSTSAFVLHIPTLPDTPPPRP
jgi:hypothetical protein